MAFWLLPVTIAFQPSLGNHWSASYHYWAAHVLNHMDQNLPESRWAASHEISNLLADWPNPPSTKITTWAREELDGLRIYAFHRTDLWQDSLNLELEPASFWTNQNAHTHKHTLKHKHRSRGVVWPPEQREAWACACAYMYPPQVYGISWFGAWTP